MNKVVLITGGDRGIGRATAITFAEHGYDIAYTYNTNLTEAENTLKILNKLNVKAQFFKCDVSQENNVNAVIQEVLKNFGKIDVLVNNSAISIDTLFQDKTAENFRKVLDVNLVGVFSVSKAVGEIMLKQKSGVIINISSTNGINTYYPMCLDYDASKAGLISLTHNLAMQFAPFVRVNAVAPGFIATKSEVDSMDAEFIAEESKKIFLRRPGTEQEVADVIYFLASEQASFVNNTVLRVDGGMYGE